MSVHRNNRKKRTSHRSSHGGSHARIGPKITSKKVGMARIREIRKDIGA